MRNRDKLGRLVITDAESAVKPARDDAARDSQADDLAISWRSVFRLVVLFAVLLVVGLGVGVLWSSGWLPGQFRLKRVAVRGCYLTSATDLMQQLKVTSDESYFDLHRQLKQAEPDAIRWFSRAHVQPKSWRSALVSIEETMPLVAVNGGGSMYWLCADGRLVPQSDADQHPVFARIENLPEIRLGFDPGRQGLPLADELLTSIACLHAAVPGEIARMNVTSAGELILFDREGFEIRLGEPTELERKIAALPKALRICAEDRDRMLYLDASNPEVFYQKWKEPVT